MTNFNQIRTLSLFCIVVMISVASSMPVKANIDLSITQRVSNDRPTPNEIVEFTITVENLGDESAFNIQVIDILPSDLILPDNQIAIPSIGTYDLSSGIWSIDELPSSGLETLLIPAMLIENPLAQCVINKASVEYALDSNLTNNNAYSGLLLGGIEACNDVELILGGHGTVGCTLDKRYSMLVNVKNNGIKNVDNILLSVEPVPELVPNLSFNPGECNGESGQNCRLSSLLPDENRQYYLRSDVFHNGTDAELTFTFILEVAEFDFAPENNQATLTTTIPVFVDTCNTIVPNETDYELGSISVSPGCFIATAAFGTDLAPEIKILREFRDKYLITNKAGRYLVNGYYRYSPPIAHYIEDKTWLKGIVRGLLWPVIYSIKYPLIAFVTFMLILSIIVKYKKR